jgi:hypothetical protein
MPLPGSAESQLRFILRLSYQLTSPAILASRSVTLSQASPGGQEKTASCLGCFFLAGNSLEFNFFVISGTLK